jgi:hypothetical protein
MQFSRKANGFTIVHIFVHQQIPGVVVFFKKKKKKKNPLAVPCCTLR